CHRQPGLPAVGDEGPDRGRDQARAAGKIPGRLSHPDPASSTPADSRSRGSGRSPAARFRYPVQPLQEASMGAVSHWTIAVLAGLLVGIAGTVYFRRYRLRRDETAAGIVALSGVS